MEFGLFTHIPWPEGADPGRVVAAAVEQVQRAEELGFAGAWLAEHHFSRYGIGSASLVLASSIAAQTRRIRLGTAVLVPPPHNPVRLAEDTATLDVVSGGRLDVGFGRGTAGYEYAGYDVDREESQERFQEVIGMVQGLWTTPDYSCEGKYFRIRQANLVPPPVQRPHPPIYIAATRSLTTLEYAVSTGHPLICGVVLDHSDAVDLCRRFVELSAAAGHNIPMGRIPFFRYCHVAETEAAARAAAEPALAWTMDMTEWRRTFTYGSEVHRSLAEYRRGRRELPPSYEYLAEQRAIIGTPEQCAAKVREFKAAGIEYFGCNFDFGGMAQDKVLGAMELFAREVMPAVG